MTILVDRPGLRISRLRLGPWQTNTYVVLCLETKASLVVDAPAEANAIIDELKGTTPEFILLTHNHLDHIGALTELRNKIKVPLGCHPLDSSGIASPPEMTLKGGEDLTLGKLKVAVIHTPGHTRGSLCFLVAGHLISGDTIFPGGPGNTRSSADFKDIVRSIKERILTLADDSAIYPGHGEPTAVAKERAEFETFSAKQHSPDLHGDVLWLSS